MRKHYLPASKFVNVPMRAGHVPSAFFFYLLSFRVLLYFIVSSDII